jgi:CHAD domain-containing protein
MKEQRVRDVPMNSAIDQQRAFQRYESLVDSIQSRVAHLATHPTIAEEPLHVLHRDLRRLVVWFRPWRASISPESRKLAKVVQTRVNSFARLCGQVRDRDVGLSVLPSAPRKSRAIGPEGIQKARSRLRREARAGRRKLARLAGALMEDHTFQALGGLVREAHEASDPNSWARQTEAEFLRRVDEVSRSLDRAVARVSTPRLHDLRKELREMRLYGETLTASRPPESAEPLVRLQRDLGKLHDLDQVIQWIRPDQDAPDVAAWTAAVRAHRRRQRRRIRVRLGRPALSHQIESLRASHTVP